jgi:exonuclease VII small subunit
MTTTERKQARALSTEEKLERLIKFVNKLVEDHNELEKRVEALERGKPLRFVA